MIKTPWWVWIPLLAGLGCVGTVDYYTEWSRRFTFFYGLFIVLVTLLKSKELGFILCVACTAYYMADRVAAHRPWDITVWNAMNEFGVLLLVWFPLFLLIRIFGLDQRSKGNAKPYR